MRDILAELLDRTPPETLFHYTTQPGLIGIVRDAEIWATHSQYLNDRREYVHAISLVRDVIDDAEETATDAAVKAALDEMRACVSDSLASINVCVCSFSEDSDSLSQWRAYGEPTAGFSIGFDSKFLQSRATKENFTLAPCLYDAENQRHILNLFVEKMVAEILEHRNLTEADEYYDFWHSGGYFRAYFHRIAPAIKDEAFKDEKEWRLISRPLMNTHPQFAYRPGKSMIIPYFRFRLGRDPGDVEIPSIRRVIVGPTPNVEVSKRSVGNLLASVRLMSNFTPGGPAKVEGSAIPYRSW